MRAFRAVGGTPVFVARAEGAYLTSADGTRYLDYVGSWGPMILGHAHPEVLAAIVAAVERGTSYGAPTELEVRFAETLAGIYPSIDVGARRVERHQATMSALRVARGFTGRDAVVKFEGCYHGHPDFLLVKAGSGGATLGMPDSAGVPAAAAANTITLRFNDVAALSNLFASHGETIAAVIVEPVVGNMGVVPPAAGFLEAIIDLCARHGAVSVFDEVMTGCRVARGGAQERFGLKPDMTCLGKIVGGGLYRCSPRAGSPSPIMRDAWRRSARSTRPERSAGTRSRSAPGLATLERLDDALYARPRGAGAPSRGGPAPGHRARPPCGPAFSASAR